MGRNTNFYLKHRNAQPAYSDYWLETKCQKSKMPDDSKLITGNIHKDSLYRKTLKLGTTEIRNSVTLINLLRQVESQRKVYKERMIQEANACL